MEKSKTDYAKELDALENKRILLLQKYDLVNGYNTFEAPKDLKNVDTKITTVADKLSMVVGQISELDKSNRATNQEFSEAFEIILEDIEEKEKLRLTEIRTGMLEYIEALKQMRIGLFNVEQKFTDDTENFDPKKDIQDYIRNRSLYQEPDDIKKLYKSKGIKMN